MPDYLTSRGGARALPITPLAPDGLAPWLKSQTASVRKWIAATGFAAEPGTHALVPNGRGEFTRVVAGIDDGKPDGFFDWGGLAARLPIPAGRRGIYRIDADLEPATASRAALAWAVGTYRFDHYKSGQSGDKGKSRTTGRRDFATLVWPKGADRAAVERTAEAIFLARDLINTPTSDMGPGDLAEAAQGLARRHKARCRVIAGDELLKKGYPAIHAVGRAAAARGPRAPRLIDLTWGRTSHPKITLVGKGVCFDTGGLGLKPSGSMKLMKKDMGGAAHVLGLAHMIMDAGLPVRLRVLIPAVENSVAGDAMRPLDVITSRKGITIEIGHTDAEGRVILSDALAEADRENPDLLLDFATLTGAARVALGTEVPCLFSNDDALAEDLLAHAKDQRDPLWRLPLWPGYRQMIDGKTADITNAAESGFAGAITAALFLQEFVSPETPWAHLDIMAWNTTSRPGRPEGGEAMGIRALFAAIEERVSRRKQGED